MEITYNVSFLRQLSKLNSDLREEAFEAVEKFKDIKNHKKLKVHKLSGRLSDYYSFSINYSHRIIFEYGKNKKEVTLLKVGDHSIYE
jgi:addiction module RelE/StbE family toxin